MRERGVAQPGSAPGLGPGGRRFESCRPDEKKHERSRKEYFFAAFLYLFTNRDETFLNLFSNFAV